LIKKIDNLNLIIVKYTNLMWNVFPHLKLVLTKIRVLLILKKNLLI